MLCTQTKRLFETTLQLMPRILFICLWTFVVTTWDAIRHKTYNRGPFRLNFYSNEVIIVI